LGQIAADVGPRVDEVARPLTEMPGDSSSKAFEKEAALYW
jgi:hypothetical protein